MSITPQFAIGQAVKNKVTQQEGIVTQITITNGVVNGTTMEVVNYTYKWVKVPAQYTETTAPEAQLVAA